MSHTHEDVAPRLVGSVGRTSTTLAIVDAHGRLRPDTIRDYAADDEPMVTGAIIRYLDVHGLGRERVPIALALAGVVRGEAVPITNSRRVVSRRGLTDLLRHPPILINDFAALGWALAGAHGSTTNSLGKSQASSSGAGTRCLIGVGDALGVVAYVNDEAGRTTVLATEAGASAIGRSAPASSVRPMDGATRFQADSQLSADGLHATYRAVCAGGGTRPHLTNGYAVARAGSSRTADPDAAKAIEAHSKALLSFVAELVLIYGAWDGVFLSGELAEALAEPLDSGLRAGVMAIPGPHSRRLASVPVGLARFTNGELNGAAIALAQSPMTG